MAQKIPFFIALFGMLLGVFIAILFGANEDMFKSRISAGLERHPRVMELRGTKTPESDGALEKFLAGEADKNWRYYQRFHFHSTGIGAMSLGILLLLSFVAAPRRLSMLASYMIAVGGFLYPFVWLFAGIYGPIMGRTAAKESFAIFGYMGGVFLVGLLLTIYLLMRYPYRPLKES